MARKILAWHGLTSDDPDVTVTVGTIAGGLAVNMVPPSCEAQIDLRYGEAGIGERVERQIRKIAETCERDGLTGTVERLGAFMPMQVTPDNQSLVTLYLAAARELGQTTDAEFTRSCADSGLTAALGVPTVCGVGPVGSNAHSPEEIVNLDSFVPRAKAVARSIARLADTAR